MVMKCYLSTLEEMITLRTTNSNFISHKEGVGCPISDGALNRFDFQNLQQTDIGLQSNFLGELVKRSIAI
jgi:hypothetical protein